MRAPDVINLVDDPLLSRVPLDLRRRYYPLGFSADVHTNFAAILNIFDETWGCFVQDYPDDPVRLSITVTGDDAGLPPAAPTFRCMGHLLTVVADPEHQGVCDMRAGVAHAWITPRALRDPVYLRDSFTDALLLVLIHSRHLAAVHAACVVRNGAGILLCGASGAGKSSLALACARRGWSLVSDDASFVVRRLGGRQVVGHPYIMRFKPEASELFSFLAGRTPSLRINGNQTIHVPSSELPWLKTAQQAEVRYLIVLDRSENGAPKLHRITQGEVWPAVHVDHYGEGRLLAEQEAALRSLSEADAYRFEYSDLDAAVECLETLVAAGPQP